MELSESQREKLIMLLQGMKNFDEINYFFKTTIRTNRDLREAYMKSLDEMEDLKRFQGSRFDEFSRRRLIENQDTILNSQPEFRKYRMKLIV